MGDQASGRNQLMNRTNSVLQFAGRKYGVNQASKHKAYLARHKLAQLFENDMIPVALMPVVGSNHLAWTLDDFAEYDLVQWLRQPWEWISTWFSQMSRLLDINNG